MYFDKLPAPLITILATFQAVGFLQAEKLPARPNVLFIAIDDMNDWTGFLGGHPQAQTPHMDRLAKIVMSGACSLSKYIWNILFLLA